MKRLTYFLIFPFALFANNIVKKPIQFTEKRIELTRQYLKEHYGIKVQNIQMVPKMIIVHWTAINSFEKSFRAMNAETLAGGREDIQKGSNLNVSAHFLVDRDGTIYQLMPLTFTARHCIGLNHCSIAIENVGGENGVQNLTDSQLKANAILVRKLKERFPTIQYLIGHHEYLKFEKHPLFLERDKNFRTKKSDPGRFFMAKLRAKVRDLQFKD